MISSKNIKIFILFVITGVLVTLVLLSFSSKNFTSDDLSDVQDKNYEEMQDKDYVNEDWILNREQIKDIEPLSNGVTHTYEEFSFKLPNNDWTVSDAYLPSEETCDKFLENCGVKIYNPSKTSYIYVYMRKESLDSDNGGLLSQHQLNNYVKSEISGQEVWLPVYIKGTFPIGGALYDDRCGYVITMEHIENLKNEEYIGRFSFDIYIRNKIAEINLCRTESSYVPSEEELRELYAVIKSIKWN